MLNKTGHKRGFSLLEIAVVLAVVGILIGAVLSGRYLMRAMELQQTISDFSQTNHAYQEFQKKYAALPGDMADATEFWDTDPNGCPSHSTRLRRIETCDGDGDGAISVAETFRAIQHLSNAGYVPGTYTGVAGPDSEQHSIPGENVFEGAEKSGLGVWTVGPFLNHPNWFDIPTAVSVVEMGTAASGRLTGPAFTPREARNLDAKIDDGKPGSGKLMAYKDGLNPGCTSSATAYALGNDGKRCALAMIMGEANAACNNSETCEGVDWVTRDCNGNEVSRSPFDIVHHCCTPSWVDTSVGACSASCDGGTQDVTQSDGCGGSQIISRACNSHACAAPDPEPSCASNMGDSCTYTLNYGPYCGMWGNCSDPTMYTNPSYCGNNGYVPNCWDTGPDTNCHTCHLDQIGTVQCDGSCS